MESEGENTESEKPFLKVAENPLRDRAGRAYTSGVFGSHVATFVCVVLVPFIS